MGLLSEAVLRHDRACHIRSDTVRVDAVGSGPAGYHFISGDYDAPGGAYHHGDELPSERFTDWKAETGRAFDRNIIRRDICGSNDDAFRDRKDCQRKGALFIPRF